MVSINMCRVVYLYASIMLVNMILPFRLEWWLWLWQYTMLSCRLPWRSAASSYAAMRMVAGSRPVLVIAWEWHALRLLGSLRISHNKFLWANKWILIFVLILIWTPMNQLGAIAHHIHVFSARAAGAISCDVKYLFIKYSLCQELFHMILLNTCPL